MTNLWHLIKRFLSSITATTLSSEEQAEVTAVLLPAENALFVRLAKPDQRHALQVLRRFDRLVPSAPMAARRAALLHDIGKIGIPDAILLKPGKLTPEEIEIMKTHTLIGASILKNSYSPMMQLAELIARSHHEWWNGTGYPDRLRGEEIPTCARIVAIVDVYDALTSHRPYREAWSKQETLGYIEDQSGTHFDPIIVSKFMQYVNRYHD